MLEEKTSTNLHKCGALPLFTFLLLGSNRNILFGRIDCDSVDSNVICIGRILSRVGHKVAKGDAADCGSRRTAFNHCYILCPHFRIAIEGQIGVDGKEKKGKVAHAELVRSHIGAEASKRSAHLRFQAE